MFKNILSNIVGSKIVKATSFTRYASNSAIDLKNLPDHRSLIIEKYGDPKESVILKTQPARNVLPEELGPNHVLVEHLAAVINPADINFAQGVYGYRPKLPTIAGGEGIMRVKSIGSDVVNLKPGDLTLGASIYGYWQTYSVRDSNELYKIDNDLDISTAVQLKVNPCTAYRMIKDFHALKADDVIIQNGANSGVGIYVIQLAKLWGIKTINVIRDRPNKDELINELMNYGATVVLTEDEVSNVERIKPVLKTLGKPKIFLNCIGGKNANDCHKTLEHGAYSVTYGAMSRQPFTPSVGSLIFKNQKQVGFWVSLWFKEHDRQEISAMFNEIGELFKKGLLKPKSTTMIDFEDRDRAFGGSSGTKYVFSINKA